jgi:hypothetical protein
MRQCISRADDPALIAFVEKVAQREIHPDEVELTLRLTITADKTVATQLAVDGEPTDEQSAKETLKRLKGSNVLILHNSTTRQDQMYYGRGRMRAFYEVLLSGNEQDAVSQAEKTVQRKIRKLAREHRDELNAMLGKLTEKYDVEFSALEGYATRRMPLGINLRDKNVEVPLNDWGSGTQNRTYILMSILSANRIRTQKAPEDKITPIIVIEEPESFLHPSAQAEFGKLLQATSAELGIQIIASTHSPYMLNQVQSSSNILLRRRTVYRRLKETQVVATSGDRWMAPFAEHLGVIDPDFDPWLSLFASGQSKVLMVEGAMDKEYFDHLREVQGDEFGLPPDVEIVPYGGKDALKNTVLVKFMISRFERVFITFDLDALDAVRPGLLGLGLKEGTDFCAVGQDKPGKKAIEGLLPERTIAAVTGRETDLVMQLTSQDAAERRNAKQRLKQEYLKEFRKSKDYTEAELKDMVRLCRVIKRAFA